MVHDIVVNKDMVDSISKYDYVLSFKSDPDVDDLRPHDYVRFIFDDGDYGKYLFGYMVTDVINSDNSEAIKAGWTVICVRPVVYPDYVIRSLIHEKN